MRSTVSFILILFTLAFSVLHAQKPLSSSLKSIAGVVSDSFGAPAATVETFMREALALEKSEGVPATVFIGLAILESAGFSSYLYQKAKGRPTDDPLHFSRTINRLSLKQFIYTQSES